MCFLLLHIFLPISAHQSHLCCLCRSWITAVKGKCVFTWWPRTSHTDHIHMTWWGRTARMGFMRLSSVLTAEWSRKSSSSALISMTDNITSLFWINSIYSHANIYGPDLKIESEKRTSNQLGSRFLSPIYCTVVWNVSRKVVNVRHAQKKQSLLVKPCLYGWEIPKWHHLYLLCVWEKQNESVCLFVCVSVSVNESVSFALICKHATNFSSESRLTSTGLIKQIKDHLRVICVSSSTSWTSCHRFASLTVNTCQFHTTMFVCTVSRIWASSVWGGGRWKMPSCRG